MNDVKDYFTLLDQARLAWLRQTDRYLIAAHRLMIDDPISSEETAAIENDVKKAIDRFKSIAKDMRARVRAREISRRAE